MNRLLWLMMNVLLLAAAYGVTTWVLEQTRPADSTGRVEDGDSGRTDRRPANREDAGGQAAGRQAAGDLAVLWRETLFRPERTEDLEVQAAQDVEAADKVPFSLELTGLAKIGDRAVAVIVQHRAAPRRPSRIVRPTTRGATRTTAPSPADGEADGAPAGPPDRHVYKVGDDVGDSGYSVKEIRLKEQEVVLVRGNEERIISLDKNDDQSSSRLKTAAAADEAAKKAQEAAGLKAEAVAAVKDAQAVAAASNPPPPPPPVPEEGVQADAEGGRRTLVSPAVTLPGAASPTMTREERLERARVLRERILQRRANSSNQESN